MSAATGLLRLSTGVYVLSFLCRCSGFYQRRFLIRNNGFIQLNHRAAKILDFLVSVASNQPKRMYYITPFVDSSVSIYAYMRATR